ncbi:MAG TPA: oligosaccharide flippase family protein [Chloroflexota bacterium]|nr:oligosaccharide flippase family protein [Chloroflexota bacterium]
MLDHLARISGTLQARLTSLHRAALVTMLTGAGIDLATAAAGILLARGLGPGGRGTFAALWLLPRVVAPLATMGIGDAATYLYSRDRALGRRLFNQAFLLSPLLGLAAAGLTVPFLGLYLRQYDGSTQQLAVVIMCIALPTGVWNDSLSALLRGAKAYGAVNAIRILQPVADLLVIAVLYCSGHLTVLTLSVEHIATAGVLCPLVQCWFLRQSAQFRPNLNWKVLRETLAYGLKTQSGVLAQVASNRLSWLVLVTILPPAQLGLFVVATTAAEALMLFPQAFALILLPEVASRSKADGVHLTQRVFKLNAAILVVAASALIVLLPFLLRLIYGPDFVAATAPARVLAAGIVCYGLTTMLAESLKGLNRPLFTTMAYSAGTGVTLALLVTLVGPLGLLGAAVATASGYLASLIATQILLRVASAPERRVEVSLALEVSA